MVSFSFFFTFEDLQILFNKIVLPWNLYYSKNKAFKISDFSKICNSKTVYIMYFCLFCFSALIFNSPYSVLLEYTDDPSGNKVTECLSLWGALDFSGHLSPFSKLLLQCIKWNSNSLKSLMH